jgi:putative ABC transport system permease protein
MLITTLTVISVALGLGLAIIVLLMSHQTESVLDSETGRWDLVIGAKGSPLQLVLNSLYYMDLPNGNINKDLWAQLQKNPAVDRVVPLTMGDSYFGSPIVGTTPDFFAGRKAANGGPILAAGNLWTKPLQAVVGADVAAHSNSLRLGKTFFGSHGWTKSLIKDTGFTYTVVGVLAPTGTSLDRAIYCDYTTIWVIHKDEPVLAWHNAMDELTSLLVSLKQPSARFGLERMINLTDREIAASPADEIQKLDATFIAPLRGLLLLVAYLVVLVSVLSILISLYLTIHQRRRDLAILRSLGATRGDIFRLITVEAALLSGLGVIVGWLFGHGLTAALAPMVFTHYGIALHPMQLIHGELTVGITVWLLGIAAGLLPAFNAYRLRVAESLMEE